MQAVPRNQDRSGDTKNRLIEAALDLFGAHGFEGTTTRQLAGLAQVNLGAIPYHFGSKEQLYQAVAEYLADQIRQAVMAETDSPRPNEEMSPQAARAALHALFDRVVTVMTSPAAERFARFIRRELMAPTPAFDVFYRTWVEPAQDRICALIAQSKGCTPNPALLRTQAIILLGQIAVFRLTEPAAARLLAVEFIGDEERAWIKQLVRFNLDAILDAGGTP